jgi:Tfp pilus assembly protein PilX
MSMQFNWRQRGAILLVSLVLLLVMTMLGVWAMQSTTLEQHMSTNYRTSNLAYLNAERALLEGENWLRTTNQVDSVANTVLLSPHGNMNDMVWGLNVGPASTDDGSSVGTSRPVCVDAANGTAWVLNKSAAWWALTHRAANPANVRGDGFYVIEAQLTKRPDIANNDPNSILLYRISARGSDETGANIAIVQSLYAINWSSQIDFYTTTCL